MINRSKSYRKIPRTSAPSSRPGANSSGLADATLHEGQVARLLRARGTCSRKVLRKPCAARTGRPCSNPPTRALAPSPVGGGSASAHPRAGRVHRAPGHIAGHPGTALRWRRLCARQRHPAGHPQAGDHGRDWARAARRRCRGSAQCPRSLRGTGSSNGPPINERIQRCSNSGDAGSIRNASEASASHAAMAKSTTR